MSIIMKNKLIHDISSLWNSFNYDNNISSEEFEQLNQYHDLLKKWSKKLNLISLKNPNEIYFQIIDSLALAPFFKSTSNIDIGSGNGFPAIPLSILNKETDFFLVEPRKKRVSFLSYVKSTLDLKNITIISQRIEDFSKKNIVTETISSKAFASPEKIQEISFKLLKKNGKIYMLLSENQKFNLLESKYCVTLTKDYKVFDKNRKIVILNKS